MPNYGVLRTGGTPVALYPGDAMTLFNAESPAAPQASEAFNRAPGSLIQPSGILFTIRFAAAAVTAQVDIEASNTDVEADYQQVFSVSDIQESYYQDLGNFAYYRARLVSQSAGGAVTVIAQR